MNSGTHPKGTFWELLGDVIPGGHARQVSAEHYASAVMGGDDPPSLVVDLGCGGAESFRLFRRLDSSAQWIGVDIPESIEATARKWSGESLVYFDGQRLPFPDDSIPLVYSKQVLEHVRRPWLLLPEVARVLKAKGRFIGSTSQLEPYHSHSVWNYTVYGFRLLLEDAGLTLKEVRPCIDGISLIRRAYEGRRSSEYNKYFGEESPLNTEIDEWAKATGRNARLVNNRKLEFCGQFAFLAVKDNSSRPG